MLYLFLRWFVVGPLVRLLFRPWMEGEEHIPDSGPAVLVSNHISAGDTFLLPAMIRRRLTFPAKQELFQGHGLKGRFIAWFMKGIGQKPMDRSGGRASATSMATTKPNASSVITPIVGARMTVATPTMPVMRTSAPTA